MTNDAAPLRSGMILVGISGDRSQDGLRWRHDHLPADQLRRPEDWRALSRLEQDAAWRLAARLGLDDDQRYSLIWHHARQVEQRVAGARCDLPVASLAGLLVRRRALLNIAAGWGTWLENLQEDLHYRWFRALTLCHYRAAPGGPERGPPQPR